MKRKLIRFVLCIALLCCCGIFLYASDYYHADEKAEAALVSDDSVEITRQSYGYFFDGPSSENAMIFYPGGKVEETAYAPFARQLAEAGMDVFVLKVPLRLAVLDIDKVDTVIDSYAYANWYVGGHSLGGVCAGYYAAENAAQLEGIVFLASYPSKQLPEDLKTVFILGSEDHVLNMEKYEENKENASSEYTEYVIEGGTHAQFGSYGEQKNDGQAAISSEEQIRQTVADIIRSLDIEN